VLVRAVIVLGRLLGFCSLFVDMFRAVLVYVNFTT
jgi:hypothetical protein